jgi:NADH-quinone oxidoreductase subunit H
MNHQWWEFLFTLPGNQIPWWAEVVRSVLRLAIGVAGALGSVPILVWLERRLLGLLQGRLGPNRVGPFGLLQPVADALKLFLKEDITPTNVDKTLYYLAPAVALAPIIMSVTVLPWNGSRDWGSVAPGLDIGILFLLGVASIEVYGVILAGWSSNNKYSLLGGLRASSQVISYELGMGLSIIAVLLMSGTLGTQAIVMGHDPHYPSGYFDANAVLQHGQGTVHYYAVKGMNAFIPVHDRLSGFWNWNVLKLFPFGLIAAVIYMISMIAETNRAPFDLPEAETELVAGFHTEYSSFKFAMFFMGEYANMLIVSAICVTLFWGGWLAPWGLLSQLPYSEYIASSIGGWTGLLLVNFINFCIIAPFWFVTKLYVLISFFILVRASLPRLRYDMLMRIGWKFLLPTALVNLVLIAVSLAVQYQVRQQQLSIGNQEPELMAWVAGQIVAWAIGAVILGVVFYSVYRDYQRRREVPDTGSTEIVPIRRESVIVPMEPAAVQE